MKWSIATTMNSDDYKFTAFEAGNLAQIRAALDHHNRVCGTPAQAVALNPIDHQLLGYESLWGVPVVADQAIKVKRFKIECPDEGADFELG